MVCWLLRESLRKTLVSGGLKLFGGDWHLASTDDTTFAGFFPSLSKKQKVSLALLISFTKSNGRKLLPLNTIIDPPESGAKSGCNFWRFGSL